MLFIRGHAVQLLLVNVVSDSYRKHLNMQLFQGSGLSNRLRFVAGHTVSENNSETFGTVSRAMRRCERMVVDVFQSVEGGGATGCVRNLGNGG